MEYSSGGGGASAPTPINKDTRRILLCPNCGQTSNGDVSHGAICARCISPDGYLTNMIPYVRE